MSEKKWQNLFTTILKLTHNNMATPNTDQLKKILDEFLDEITRLKIEHEKKIQQILKGIDERQLKLLRDKLHQISYDRK